MIISSMLMVAMAPPHRTVGERELSTSITLGVVIAVNTLDRRIPSANPIGRTRTASFTLGGMCKDISLVLSCGNILLHKLLLIIVPSFQTARSFLAAQHYTHCDPFHLSLLLFPWLSCSVLRISSAGSLIVSSFLSSLTGGSILLSPRFAALLSSSWSYFGAADVTR